MYSFDVKTTGKEELVDISSQVQQFVKDSGKNDGICCVYTPHTTAGITINENADPTVQKDILKGLAHLKLESVHFLHMEGNSPSHIKSSIIGCSEMLLVEDGKLILGTWQGIYFCEFDGPRTRKVMVKFA